MPSRRHRTARNLTTLALHAPFVAAHRLSNDLASQNPVTWCLGWQAVMFEKWLAGAEVAAALAGSAMKRSPRGNLGLFEALADASLAPVARRVRRNATAIRRAPRKRARRVAGR